jgi:hypothetical protein
LADVDDRGRFSRALLGKVEVAGDVDLRHALERQLLDEVVALVERAGDDGFERRAVGPGEEAEHVTKLFESASADAVEDGGGGGLLESAGGDGAGARLQVGPELLLAAEHGIVRGLREGGQRESRERGEPDGSFQH